MKRTDFAWLKDDGDLLGVCAFVKDRERQTLVGLVEFVSAPNSSMSHLSFISLSQSRRVLADSYLGVVIAGYRVGVRSRRRKVSIWERGEREKAYKAVNEPQVLVRAHSILDIDTKPLLPSSLSLYPREGDEK
jgi:hypothetical protein